jgi:hypothetical protein
MANQGKLLIKLNPRYFRVFKRLSWLDIEFYALKISMSFYLFNSILCAKILCVYKPLNWFPIEQMEKSKLQKTVNNVIHFGQEQVLSNFSFMDFFIFANRHGHFKLDTIFFHILQTFKLYNKNDKTSKNKVFLDFLLNNTSTNRQLVIT